jgi:hypothetical protein
MMSQGQGSMIQQQNVGQIEGRQVLKTTVYVGGLPTDGAQIAVETLAEIVI